MLLPLHYRLVLYYSMHTKLYAAAAASLPVMFDGPDSAGVSVFSDSGGIGELVPGAFEHSRRK